MSHFKENYFHTYHTSSLITRLEYFISILGLLTVTPGFTWNYCNCFSDQFKYAFLCKCNAQNPLFSAKKYNNFQIFVYHQWNITNRKQHQDSAPFINKLITWTGNFSYIILMFNLDKKKTLRLIHKFSNIFQK